MNDFLQSALRRIDGCRDRCCKNSDGGINFAPLPLCIASAPN